MRRFENRVALITGATSGMGQQMAKQLLEEGAKVVINYAHNEENAKQTMELFKEYADNILLVKADISDEEQVKEMFNKIENRFNQLDFVVNNAAYDKILSVEDLTPEEFRKELDVNLVARWMCIKYAIPLLKQSDYPRVVNIASRLGTKPMEDSLAYCTCEAGTIMLTKVCALELSKYNIRVNTVSPSLTLTPLARQSYTDEEIKATAMKNPSKRLGECEDTANVVLFLLSKEADYINGENINVNGGILLV
jgi:NAD(P)-dependent dehydrogenase (short-subunit alcohol dehydrogenase family)